jgi:hypothetical protein
MHAFPLTSAQREVWFDQMLHPDIPLYNIGGYVHILGKLDTALFEQAVNLLVQQHEALRTVLLEDTNDGLALVVRSLAEIYSALVSSSTAPVLLSPGYTAFVDNDRRYVESSTANYFAWLAQQGYLPHPS